MKTSDAILGGGAMLLGGAVYLNTLSFPRMPDGSPGPALFPQILATLIGLFGFVLVLQSRRPHVTEERGYPLIRILKGVGVLVSIAIYILVSHSLGFLITATLISLGLMLMLDVRILYALPTSLGLSFFCLVLFDRVLRVPLPVGLLGL